MAEFGTPGVCREYHTDDQCAAIFNQRADIMLNQTEARLGHPLPPYDPRDPLLDLVPFGSMVIAFVIAWLVIRRL